MWQTKAPNAESQRQTQLLRIFGGGKEFFLAFRMLTLTTKIRYN